MGGTLTICTHSLLRVALPAQLGQAPAWVAGQLARAPWVVVRRERVRAGLIPVGVRGDTRAQRFAGWLAPQAACECLTPLELAAQRGWKRHPRAARIAALAALEGVEPIMARHGLGLKWGPTGSLGFELASGVATMSAASDLDLIVQADEPIAPAAAWALWRELAQLPARADVLLETLQGAVSLPEYAQARAPYLLRTDAGARLIGDPWSPEAAAA